MGISAFATTLSCLGISGAALLLGGCIRNTVVLDCPQDPVPHSGETYIGEQKFVSPPGPKPEITRTGHLPQEFPLSAWLRYQDGPNEGRIARDERILTTPIPWWQWFPLDLPATLLPVELVTLRHERLQPILVPARDPLDLDREAREAGYAHGTRAQP